MLNDKNNVKLMRSQQGTKDNKLNCIIEISKKDFEILLIEFK